MEINYMIIEYKKMQCKVIGIIFHPILSKEVKFSDNHDFLYPQFICTINNEIIITMKNEAEVNIIDATIPKNWEYVDDRFGSDGFSSIYTKQSLCFGEKNLFSTNKINRIFDDGIRDLAKL
jgi:hypothetical protein